MGTLQHYLFKPILRLAPIAFSAAIISIIFYAWLMRDEGYLTAETGIGYWLGIVGAAVMLLLLLYPMRKRLRILRSAGRIPNWFRAHMILGIVGPTLVILHTNFKLGSLNSRLALLTMLVVVASGVIGRYLYAKVHKGLYGKQAALAEILDDIDALKDDMGEGFAETAEIRAMLEPFGPRKENSRSIARMLAGTSRLRTGGTRRAILRAARRSLDAERRAFGLKASAQRRRLQDLDSKLSIFFAAVRKARRFSVYERLFGYWHHLHVPLFALLTLTVVMHILAVHRY